VRIAWVTPLSERSAVAEFSVNVVEALARRVDVDLWTGEDEPRRTVDVRVIDLDGGAGAAQALGSYDVVAYNLGDTGRYHRRIYEQSRRMPGTVVLHDRAYQNLFVGSLFLDDEGQPRDEFAAGDAYAAAMRSHYGDAGGRAAEQSLKGNGRPVWEEPKSMLEFPLIEEMLRGATSAVVHSRGHYDELRSRWLGPVAPLFLPAYPTVRELPPPPDAETLTLVTVGVVNENKQIDRTIAALESDRDLARRVRYVVVGAYDARQEYVKRLQRQIDESGLSNTVTLRGHVSDAELEAIFEAAHVFVNLRYPSLESGSASLMRQLAAGRPVLANDVGIFAEIPAGAIVRISNDQRALTSALRELAADEVLRARIGTAAARTARALSVERYADAFVEFTRHARRAGAAVAAVERVAATLVEISADPRLPAIDRTAAELDVIVGPVASPTFVAAHELRPDDADALADLFEANNVPDVVQSFDPFPLTAETAKRLANHQGRDRFYVAREGPSVVAFSMLRGWDEGYDVPSFGILVDRSRHGQGIGTVLTDWTVRQAAELGADSVRLSVYASNPAAYGIYVRLGFVEEAREEIDHDGVREERIVMIKEVRASG
jgi:glycosyltransferase involved in cell wall biosynthesis/ribosomal protein S18 acetylase RimI-like enzyme